MDVKVAAFGEKDIITIFKSAGVDIFPIKGGKDNISEAEDRLRQLVSEGYGIIFMTETIASKLDNLVREYANDAVPSIVVIPGLGERNEYAVNNLRRAIIKAVGADIMAEEKNRSE
jgi:V/A-type H+-transporting ATPase subunit F